MAYNSCSGISEVLEDNEGTACFYKISHFPTFAVDNAAVASLCFNSKHALYFINLRGCIYDTIFSK